MDVGGSPVCFILASVWKTSGLASRVGSAQQRLRLVPAALVRRWPR